MQPRHLTTKHEALRYRRVVHGLLHPRIDRLRRRAALGAPHDGGEARLAHRRRVHRPARALPVPARRQHHQHVGGGRAEISRHSRRHRFGSWTDRVPTAVVIGLGMITPDLPTTWWCAICSVACAAAAGLDLHRDQDRLAAAARCARPADRRALRARDRGVPAAATADAADAGAAQHLSQVEAGIMSATLVTLALIFSQLSCSPLAAATPSCRRCSARWSISITG